MYLPIQIDNTYEHMTYQCKVFIKVFILSVFKSGLYGHFIFNFRTWLCEKYIGLLCILFIGEFVSIANQM